MAQSGIIEHARHRGRILTTSEGPVYAKNVLASLGFGPRILVWDDPAKLPAGWPNPHRVDQYPVDQPPYWTYFFEADWQRPLVDVPMKNPNPPTPDEIQGGALDWLFYDLAAYCWTDPSWGTPPYGLEFCEDTQPPPWQGPPPLDDPPPVDNNPPPQPTPGSKPSAKTSPWYMALGAIVVAIPIGLYLVNRHRPTSSLRSSGKVSTRVSSPSARRSTRA